ncbi:MAG: family 16 glycosylhydrolase [Candidatus Methanoperedens sp.]|nr:family 16 glycosylhydrolase [Candidatus Methanoperedens sp.]
MTVTSPSTNLAPNSGFETDPLVDYFTYGKGTFTWANDAAHTGSRSTKIVSIQPTGSYARWMGKTDKTSGQAGSEYSASVWMKSISVVQYGKLVINFWDASLNYLGGTESSGSIRGTTDWTQLAVQGIAPSKTAFVRVEFRLYGPGTLWVDDVNLGLKTATSTPAPTPALTPASTPASTPTPTPTPAFSPLFNLAPNPGFENDPAVDYFSHGNGAFTWATDAAHTGTRSSKIVSSQPVGSYVRWLSKTDKISGKAGNEYDASVWMKTNSVTQYGKLVINFWDASLGYLGGRESAGSIRGTTNWTQLKVQGIAPSKTAYVRVEFRLYGPGTLWVDDVNLGLKTAASTLTATSTPTPTPTQEPTPNPTLKPSGSYTLFWSDEFNGNTLSSDWRVYGGNQSGATSDTLFHSNMVKVSNGQLHLGIAMNPSNGRKYIGGGVDNLNSVTGKLTQGRWEIRAKMPQGFGADGYIGLYKSDGKWPPEIVIAENIGKRPIIAYLIQVYSNTLNKPAYDVTQVTGTTWNTGFHVYTFEWDNSTLKWYVDGNLKKTSKQLYPTVPMKFGMGAWSGICGSDWPDCASSKILPAYLDIDYVRIYRKN